jgi:hypothetical protein
MIDQIIKMSDNIGSLSLFLNNPKNIEYLNFLNNKIPLEARKLKTSEKVYYLINDINEPILCECGEHRSFIGFKNGYRPTCSKKECFVKKRKETTIKKYGVDNPLKVEKIKEKVKNTNIKKYGATSPMKCDLVKDKFKKTMLQKHGVEWAQQSNTIKEKSRITWENNEKKEEIILNRKRKYLDKTEEEKNRINDKKIESIINKWGSYDKFINYRLDKIRKSSLNKFNTEHHLKSDLVAKKRIEKYINNITNKYISRLSNSVKYIDRKYNVNKTDLILELNCLKCNNNFKINRQLFKSRLDSNVELCLNCNPILSGKSNRELEVLSFIEENYKGEILKNTKSIIKGELDIYLPKKTIAFEFNGLYWHSELYKEKEYHLNKTIECNKKEIQLIHIWEDDWDNKKEIVKSIILNKINLTPNKIFARKCQIKEITNNLVIREFLNKNHIQGFIGSKIKIGLFYNDELVSLMTFGSLRKNMGQTSIEGSWELLRFCNKLNTIVIGGASKLFNYFIKKYSPDSIISYSDLSRGNGNLYSKLGFNKQHETKPNYYWIVDGIRKNRFEYRKDVLVKMGENSLKTEVNIMNSKGYYRFFDCGSIKWVKFF